MHRLSRWSDTFSCRPPFCLSTAWQRVGHHTWKSIWSRKLSRHSALLHYWSSNLKAFRISSRSFLGKFLRIPRHVTCSKYLAHCRMRDRTYKNEWPSGLTFVGSGNGWCFRSTHVTTQAVRQLNGFFPIWYYCSSDCFLAELCTRCAK